MKTRSTFIILFLSIICINNAFAQTASDILEVVFIDLESSGDSTLVVLPNNATMLIDGGWYFNNPYNRISSTLSEYGINNLDVIIATHPDADHFGGLSLILKRNDFTVDITYISPVSSTKTTYIEFLSNAATFSNKGLTELRQGEEIVLDEKVKIEILNPPTNELHEPSNSQNENVNSIVTRLQYGDITFLFTGDATRVTESWLIENYQSDYLDIDIMNSPHHGSIQTSNSEEFIDVTSPKLVIFSANLDNTHDHPHEETKQLYAQKAIPAIQTGEKGNIVIRTDGKRCSLLISGETEKPCFDGVQIIPEFPLTLLILVSSFIPVLILTRKKIIVF